mmetsp:Transcript_35821/g.94001  ORF Transcript_35821/g.94001 Transcript_35821/m.94001 type:complete len:96 (+) Transcript_35821:680-967(+)
MTAAVSLEVASFHADAAADHKDALGDALVRVGIEDGWHFVLSASVRAPGPCIFRSHFDPNHVTAFRVSMSHTISVSVLHTQIVFCSHFFAHSDSC